MNPPCHNQAGFNLLELMIVISILGVMTAIALPSFRTLTLNNCLSSQTNRLVSSLHLARSEAILRQTNVILRAKDNDLGNEWGTGWRVTVRAQGGGAEEVLNDVSITECPNTKLDDQRVRVGSGATSEITFFSNGFSSQAGTINIDVCDDRTGETGRRVILPVTGRPQLQRISCS